MSEDVRSERGGTAPGGGVPSAFASAPTLPTGHAAGRESIGGEGKQAVASAVRWAAVIFPFAAWLMATLYLGGKIGYYGDDYAINLVDPVTGRLDPTASPFAHNPYFWRPAHQFLTAYLLTFLWHDFAVFHWLAAAVHGLVGVAIWRLSGRLTSSRLAAVIPALLFVVMPFSYEVTLWCTSWVIAMAALLSVMVMILCADVARGTRSWWWMPLIATAAFLVPCFYEQPGAGLAPIALLYFAVCPRSESWKRRLWRAGCMTAILGATQLAYVVLLAKTAPPWARGGEASLVRPSDAGARLGELSSGVAHVVTRDVPEIIAGAFTIGHDVLGTWRGAMIFAAFAACGGVWLLWALTRGGNEGSKAAPPALETVSGRLFAGAFGGAVAIVAWLPAAALKSQVIEPRMMYFGMVGVAILLAWLLDVAHAAARTARCDALYRGLVAAPTMAVVCYLAVCCVGLQGVFRERWRADEYQVSELRRMIPDPPSNAVFVTLEDDYRPVRTGRPTMDMAFQGWSTTSWSSSPWLRLAYGRRDVHGIQRGLFAPTPLADLDITGFRSPGFPFEAKPNAELPWDPNGGLRVSWAKAIPFVIDAEGRPRLVHRLFIERPDNEDLEIRAPLVAQAVTRGMPHMAFSYGTSDAPEGGVELGAWKWSVSGSPAGAGWAKAWETGRPAMRLHPAADGGWRSCAETTVPASADVVELVFRATLAEERVTSSGGGNAGVAVSWYAGDDPNPIGHVELSTNTLRQQRRWLPVTIRLEPDSRDRVLRMRVTPLGESGTDVPEALVTPGWSIPVGDAAGARK